jgi:broad specificity phosphatase PhoE
VSSLQCPTRVFVVRHGEAEYETDAVTDDGGSLTPLGRAQARGLAERLRGERISRVWTSPLSRAVQTAEIAAGPLGVDVVVREGLREIPGGDRIDSFVDRVATVFEEVADQHRGEAVLVVSHGGAILAAVPHLPGLPAAFVRDRTLENCGVIELVTDAEGWQPVSWCGTPM